MTATLRVVAMGALTAVGLTSAQTCAAVRAGISAVAASDFLLQSADWERVLAASTALRPRASDSNPVRRALALARFAIEECLESAALAPRRTALLLGVPEPERLDRWHGWYGEDLHVVFGAELLPRFHASSRLLAHGHASALIGLKIARELLEAGTVDVCLVGGTDSMLNSADLDGLEKGWRLHRSGEPNGLVPGEGAALVGLARAAQTGTRHAAYPAVEILGIGLDAEESATSQASGGQPTGAGMVRALRKSLQEAQLPEGSVGLRITDVNGERYRAMDAFLAVSRYYRTHREGLPLWHPAENIGDIGAAVGGLLLQIASRALVRGYAPAQTVMCEASSDSGLRAACLVRGSARERP